MKKLLYLVLLVCLSVAGPHSYAQNKNAVTAVISSTVSGAIYSYTVTTNVPKDYYGRGDAAQAIFNQKVKEGVWKLTTDEGCVIAAGTVPPAIKPTCSSVISCDFQVAVNSPTVGCNENATLTTTASGTGATGLNYYWATTTPGSQTINSTYVAVSSGQNGTYTYMATVTKTGCAAKSALATVTVNGCGSTSIASGVYAYKGDDFNYTPLASASTSNPFPAFESGNLKVTLALRNQKTESQVAGMGGAIYQIFNKNHNATHTLVYNANRYNGDDNGVVDRSGPPNRIFTGQGLSECLYFLPKPFYANQSDGAAGSSYPVNEQNPPGYDGGLGMNPNEVGDDWNNSGELITYGTAAGKFYTKTRPPVYGQNRLYLGDQFIFEKWGSLDGNWLSLNYQSTFNRTYTGRHVTKAQENPCLYTNGLRYVKFYDGDKPYTNDGVTTIICPVSSSNQLGGMNGIRPNGLNLSEPGVWMGNADGYGIGLLLYDNIKAAYGFFGDGGFDGPNPSGGGSFGYIGGSAQEILDNKLIWRHRCKLFVGTYEEFRAAMYALSYRPAKRPQFKFNAPGRHGWSLNSGDGNDMHTWDDPFDGNPRAGWKVYFGASSNAVIQSPAACWETAQFNSIYFRYKYSGKSTQWALKFTRNRQQSDGAVETNPAKNRFASEDQIRYANGSADTNPNQTVLFSVIPDGEWHVAEIILAGNPAWQGVINQIRIKPHTNPTGTYPAGEYAIIDWVNTINADPGN